MNPSQIGSAERAPSGEDPDYIVKTNPAIRQHVFWIRKTQRIAPTFWSFVPAAAA